MTGRAASPKAKSRTRAPAEVKSDEPLYLQVVRALKDEIVSGVHPVGAQLPTEEELGERFSVSRYTVREALRRLREDSLVSSRQGAGTIVVAPRPSDSYVHEVMSINDLVAFATGVRFAIDTIELIEIDDELALRTGIPNGENWLAVRGFRHTEGNELPVCYTEVYINRDFAAIGRLLQRHTGPIFHLIEDLFGQSIVEVHQEIAAALMSPALAAGLKAKTGATALEVQRTYKLATGKIAQVAINTHPASRFRHSMTMRRVKG
ncbi:MAG: GntR family transcriptional regulator [Bradyrhizobium sp.]